MGATHDAFQRAEDSVLQRGFPTCGATLLAPMLPGRTIKSIQRRADRLGLKSVRGAKRCAWCSALATVAVFDDVDHGPTLIEPACVGCARLGDRVAA